jgi:hypothetical protein
MVIATHIVYISHVRRPVTLFIVVVFILGILVTPATAVGSEIVISSPKTFTTVDRTNPVIIDGTWVNFPTCRSGGNYLTVKVFGAPKDYKGYNYNYGGLKYDNVDLEIDENIPSYWQSPQPGPEGGLDYDFTIKIGGNYSGQTFHLSISTKGWAPGSYPVTISGGSLTFRPEECGVVTPGSMTIVIPPLLTPKIKCSIEASAPIRKGDAVDANCNSDVYLSKIPLEIQNNTNGTWINTGKVILANGNQFKVLNIPTEFVGGNSMRLYSVGVADKLSAFNTEVFAYKVQPALVSADIKIKLEKFESSGPMKIIVLGAQALDSGLQLTLKSSIAPAGPWTIEKSFKSGVLSSLSVNKPKGTWLLLSAAANEEYASTDSQPIQLLETPSLTCSITSPVKEGSKVTGKCFSTSSLLSTPISYEYNDGQGWENMGAGTFAGKSLSFSFSSGAPGNSKIRINSVGLSGNYTAFISNVMNLQVLNNPLSASGAIKTPSGKVDKTSNAYKTMYTVGSNFAKVSMANDTAESQCGSAMRTGLIRARGIPQYLGVQTKMIQSYLKTASGWRGCLDGFGK